MLLLLLLFGYTAVKRLFGGNQNLAFLWFHPVLILLREIWSMLVQPPFQISFFR